MTVRRLAIALAVLAVVALVAVTAFRPYLEMEGYYLPWWGERRIPFAASLSAAATGQGELLGVVVAPAIRRPLAAVTGRAPDLPGQSAGGLAFYRQGDTWVALVPVTYSTAPGDYALTLAVTDFRQQVHEVSLTIRVEARDFPVQRLQLTSQQTSLLSADRMAEDRANMAAARSAPSPRPLWQGAFVLPVDGRVTTEYGLYRYINGAFSSRHSGIDWGGVPAGTPVKAAAAGRVSWTGQLWASGNTVVVDHGLGLFTAYNHLSRIVVAADQMVAAGEVVGEVGSTGLSTGPHLHFTLYAGTIPINPWPWFGADPAALLAAPGAGGD